MFQLPWEHPNIKAIIDAFECTVIDVVTLQPDEPEKRLVVWRDDTNGITHSEYMTSKHECELSELLDEYGVGVIIGSGWWSKDGK